MQISDLAKGNNRRPGTSVGRDMVAIVEDDCDTLMLVKELLQDVGFFVETFAGAMEFLSAALNPEPSCILLDVRLHGMSGLDLQERLSQEGSQSQIVFMTGYADVNMSVRAMKAGAFDFIQKPFREQEIIDAVCRAHLTYRQRVHASEAVAAFDAKLHSLTVREREVLSGVVDGQLNKQIAATLGISEITVKVHRGNLMRKMQARTLAELVKNVSLHFSFGGGDESPAQRAHIGTASRSNTIGIRDARTQIFA